MFCSNCKKEIIDKEANFCPKCGNLLNNQQKENTDTPSVMMADSKNNNYSKIESESKRFDFIEIIDKKAPVEDIKTEVKRNFEAFEIENFKNDFEAIIESASVNDAKIIQKFREKISEHFNSIPHHNFPNLGNEILIEEVVYIPCYYVELKTFYNKRDLKEGKLPYIYTREYGNKTKTFDNVNVWDYNTKSKGDFVYSVVDYVIEGSQEVKICINCRGNGRIVCYICSGRGRNTCLSCHGKGTERCWLCSGNGFREESRYDSYTGTYIRQRINCSNCGGRGFNMCGRCNGSGTVICSSCGGSGFLTCRECAGKGKIVEFLYFTDIYDNKIQNFNFFHKTVPESLKNKIFSSDELKLSAKFVGDYIPEQIVDFIKYEIVKKKIKTFIGNIDKFKELGIINKNYKILKNSLEIKKIDLYRVNYKFIDATYNLFLTDGKIIVYEKSPVLDVANKYYIEGILFERAARLSNAYEMVKSASDMYPDIIDWKLALNRIENKIYNQYRNGTYIGVILLFIFSMVFYFKEFSFNNFSYTHNFKNIFRIFAEPVYFLFNVFCFFISANFTFKFFKNKYGINIKSAIKRYTFSFIVSSLLYIVLFLVFNIFIFFIKK